MVSPFRYLSVFASSWGLPFSSHCNSHMQGCSPSCSFFLKSGIHDFNFIGWRHFVLLGYINPFGIFFHFCPGLFSNLCKGFYLLFYMYLQFFDFFLDFGCNSPTPFFVECVQFLQASKSALSFELSAFSSLIALSFSLMDASKTVFHFVHWACISLLNSVLWSEITSSHGLLN